MPRNKETSQQMRAESRKKLLSAGRRLFAGQGYFSCRVSDIAREAEMSQGNFYWYFSGKEELLKAILAEGFEDVGAILEEAHASPGTGMQKLAFATDRYIELGQAGNEFFTIFLSLLAHGGMPFLHELGFDTTQIGHGYHRLLSEIIATAQSEGSVADIEPNFLTMFFFSFFNGLFLTYGTVWGAVPSDLIRSAVLRLMGSDLGQ
jgi:TetR/AcrR family fatty acid metabolism transcriptional regulator